MDRIKANINQHFYWPNLRDDIFTHIKVFKTCHKNRENLKYFQSFTKESEDIQRDRFLVDIIGQFKNYSWRTGLASYTKNFNYNRPHYWVVQNSTKQH